MLAPLFDDEGRVTHLIPSGIDITDRKQVQEALEWSNERLEILSETASRLLTSDAPQQIVDTLCQRAAAFLDCEFFFNFLLDEQQKRLYLNAYGGIPEEAAKALEWLELGVAVCGCVAMDGHRIVAENIPSTQDPRTDLVRSLGVRAYACHPLIAQGKVIGTLSFGTRSRSTFSLEDVSLMKTVADEVAVAVDRVRLLEQLTAERARWQATVESMLDPVTVCDAEGRATYMNTAYSRMLGRKIRPGVSLEEHAAEYQLYRPDGRIAHSCDLPLQRAALSGQAVRDVELIQRGSDGSEHIAMWNAAPLCDGDGQVVGAVAVGREVTRAAPGGTGSSAGCGRVDPFQPGSRTVRIGGVTRSTRAPADDRRLRPTPGTAVQGTA